MSDAVLTDKQIEVINNMTDENRYEYLISQMKHNQKVWTLADNSGCLLINTGEENCLVVFSHQQLAENWTQVDHATCTPTTIELTTFVEKWLPGMEKDGFHIAIQPNMDGESIIASASEFLTNFDG